MASFIFASPTLLSSVRGEIDACCSGNTFNRVIDTNKLTRNCPTFLAATSEVLRIAAPIHVSRLVLEDTLVTLPTTSKKIFLAKGNPIQIATSVIHRSQISWGDDAKTFNPGRFLPRSGGKIKSSVPQKKELDISRPVLPEGVDRGSWRSFGGGHNICPGRHFAQVGIMSMVGLLVAGYEITAPDGSAMVPPCFANSMTLASTLKPSGDVEVNIKRREGFAECRWHFGQ